MNKTVAYILFAIGGLTILSGFGDLSFFQILMGGLFSLGGYRVLQNSQKALTNAQNYPNQMPAQKFEINDEMIIRLAQRLGKGRLSVEDVISQTSLTRDQAKAKLESLHERGICELKLDEISDSGKIYYYF